MRVQLFIPCYIDQLYPTTAFNTIKVLEKVGCKVDYNPNQTCCGQPTFNSGYWQESSKMAKKFLKDFHPNTPIISPSGSCTGFIKHHYPQLLQDNNTDYQKFTDMKEKIYELSDFLVNILKVSKVESYFPYKVTYHDSCSALREYGIKNEPRKLLENVNGLELIEMSESDTCCGFGGTFAVKFSSISSSMVENKVMAALATQAAYIVGTEASCLMNINSYCQKHKLPIKGIHLVDVLANGI